MILKEFIRQLQEEIAENPERAEQSVYVYLTKEPIDGLESPTPILDIDFSISDRIDINC